MGGGTGHRNCGTQRERERVVCGFKSFSEFIIEIHYLERGGVRCMCGVQAAASSSVRTHRTFVGASSGKENMPILNRSSDNLGKVLLSA